MQKSLTFILLLCISFSVSAEKGLNISITKSVEGTWTLKYKLDHEIDRLGLTRNPDNSRTKRWLPISKDIEITYVDGKEYIVKKDGSPFSLAEFTLTPTYIHLVADYAPFSPYSDGGTLLYSGRYFACDDSCSEQSNGWNLSISVPEDEHIIVNGKIYTSFVSWQGKNSGQNVYVGKQKPVETDTFIAVIDAGLPSQIRTSLDKDLPRMMRYFERRLGRLRHPSKPTLFASYAKVEGQSTQGGTLPSQIFMHWNINNLELRLKNENFIHETTWFFAHEIAHLYQSDKEGQSETTANQSWLHEGNADLLASLVLLHLYPDSKNYVDFRFETSKSNCIKGLQKFPLVSSLENGRFDLYYNCGFLLHRAIDTVAKKRSNLNHSIYTIWNNYRDRLEEGSPAGQETFLEIVDEYAGQEVAANILKMVDTKLDSPADFIDQLTIAD